MSISALPPARVDALLESIEKRREELVDLARELIGFPTVNPPGEAYRPCAEFIGARMKKRGFLIEYVRAEGTPGDADRYPRINVIARRESGAPGRCVHFNGHIDVVQTRLGVAGCTIWRSVASSRRPAWTTSSSPSPSTWTGSASGTAASGGPRSTRMGASLTAPCRYSGIAPCAT